MMHLYHGSNVPIDSVDLTKSRIAKDFGCGFYLTTDKSQAQKIAETTFSRTLFGEPTISTFLFDESNLINGNLTFKSFDDYTVEWAEFIFSNRNNKSRKLLHSYDVVYGPIADDNVGLQLRRFMEGYIDIARLIEELKYKRKTFQYFFGTEKAISKLLKI